jgi:hypothetical protein
MVSAQIQVPCNKYYVNFISEMWFSVRLVVEAAQFREMKDSALYEFCDREYTKKGDRIQVEPKDKMKERMGYSPDLADTVAIGLEGARRLGFTINMKTAVEHKSSSDEWKNRVRQKSRELYNQGALNFKD